MTQIYSNLISKSNSSWIYSSWTTTVNNFMMDS